MIARHWHAKIPTRDAESYKRLILKVAIPYYSSIEGLVDYCFLKRTDGEATHFDLFTYWEDYESIKKFTGNDIEKAQFYDEEKTYLFEFEPNVKHYEVFAGKNI